MIAVIHLILSQSPTHVTFTLTLGNVIVVSCPSLLDPSLAPEGYHVIHAYTAGNEPYEVWEKFENENLATNEVRYPHHRWTYAWP